MIENLNPAEYDALLRQDFETFAARCFHDVSPHTQFSPNWHIEVIAAKLMAVRQGKIRRLIINLPPRSFSHPASCITRKCSGLQTRRSCSQIRISQRRECGSCWALTGLPVSGASALARVSKPSSSAHVSRSRLRDC